jgi:hypothetical protein
MKESKFDSVYVSCDFYELKEVLENYNNKGYFVLSITPIYVANQPNHLGIYLREK